MSQPCSTDAMGVSPPMGVEGKDGSLCHFLIFRPLRAVAHGQQSGVVARTSRA